MENQPLWSAIAACVISALGLSHIYKSITKSQVLSLVLSFTLKSHNTSAFPSQSPAKYVNIYQKSIKYTLSDEKRTSPQIAYANPSSHEQGFGV